MSVPALDLIRNQRACRSYTDDPVADADVETMLEAATHAPSAENRQPWVFVVVRDATRRRAIGALTRRVWEAGARAHSERALEPHHFRSVDRFFSEAYGGAPVLVVVAGDGRDGTPAAVLASSVYLATQNLLLAAAALGYGSSMTTLAAHVPDDLRAIVDLPAGVQPFAVVPIGRATAPLGPPRRRPVSAVAHTERFGTPFPPVSDQPSELGEPPPPAPPPA